MKSAFKFATAVNYKDSKNETLWIWKKHKTIDSAKKTLLKLSGLNYKIIDLDNYDVNGNFATPKTI